MKKGKGKEKKKGELVFATLETGADTSPARPTPPLFDAPVVVVNNRFSILSVNTVELYSNDAKY